MKHFGILDTRLNMASKLLRKSGVAVGLILDLLEWVPNHIFQVGVGQHHHEVDVLKETWPDVGFIGFEPHPEIVQSLKDYPGIIHELALSNYVGKAVLHGKKSHKDGSSLYEHKQEGNYQDISVAVANLDNIYRHGPVGDKTLLWIDCEGSELTVLQGAVSFIQGVQVVNIEMTSDPPGKGWCDPVDVHYWLVGKGFYTQWIHTQRSSAGQCDAIYVKKELFNPRYCCVPSEVKRYEEMK